MAEDVAEDVPIPSETQRIRAAMRVRYARSHALIEELPNEPNGGSGRIDAVAVSMYRSKAFELIGFEIKISRGDWLRELKAPQKSERFRKHCALWYLVTTPGVAEKGELPPGWGMMVLTSRHGTDGLSVTRAARRNRSIEPITVPLWASLLRGALKASPSGEEFARGVLEGRRRERIDRDVKWAKQIRDAQDKFSWSQALVRELQLKLDVAKGELARLSSRA